MTTPQERHGRRRRLNVAIALVSALVTVSATVLVYAGADGADQPRQFANAAGNGPADTSAVAAQARLLAYPNPGLVTGSTGAHDPAVAKAADGTYVVVTTGDNLPIKTSTDRTAWRDAGVVWPGGAPWTTPYTNGSRSLWAPDISYRNGQFYLYYSASSFGSQRSAIFLATSPTGAAGTWTDQGMII